MVSFTINIVGKAHGLPNSVCYCIIELSKIKAFSEKNCMHLQKCFFGTTIFSKMERSPSMNLLFLGASNTDCGHCFTSDNLGTGYVRFVYESLQALCMKRGLPLSVTNGGTDGFTFPRIFEKWSRMYRGNPCDAVVILCGVNEVGVIHNTGLTKDQTAAYLSNSKKSLSHLLHELTGEGVPHILLLEPFLFRRPDYLNLWMPTLEQVRAMICSCVPTEASPAGPVHYLPTQQRFDCLAAQLGLNQVTSDGIHLTEAGHRHLAKQVTDALVSHLYELRDLQIIHS